MKVNHGISVNKWLLKQKNILKGLDILKTTTNLKSLYYEDKEMRDIMKEYYQIRRNLIISILFLIQHNCILSRRSSI